MPEGTGDLREAEEVARLLQELKSRSGLSYGALAKKLHVSTSALHRYCNGDVMPVEFAPLERLARLCRATPEERTELYRLWGIAHAARANRQAPAPATAPETAAEPEPAPAAEEPAVGGAAGAGAAAPERAPAVPPRRRVRRGALAAVTAAAVLAAIGAVATGLDTHSDGPPAPVPARAVDAGPSAESPTPAAVDKPVGAATSTGAGANPSGPTGAADQGASAPIAVAVHPSHGGAECDKYLVDRPPSEVPRPPALVDVPAWVSRVGAVPGNYQSIELTVQGTGSETVVLTALNVRIARIAAPLAWNAYSMGDGCGGGVGVHSFDLDLDAALPRPVVLNGPGLPVKVSERDPEVIEVTAATTSHDVSWYLELEWTSGNRKGTLTIGPGAGTPFRTSALKGRPLYSYPTGGKAWEPSPFQK
ncbi:helix-turn-helix domain-containing protein [Kitasatospora sp. NPDC056446]|uniref:helix-turn-helix domain-containing protein n=1 Tax=Kitasatospora sp. NPDC056446 TaxID=3345819 RepID=UPI0036C48980